MPRRIQRKPKRYLSERTSKAPTPTPARSFGLQELVSILGGVTGILVAILWLGGRFYMAGYFGAMNIPAFQVNFSVWEYAEAAWSQVLVYFLTKIFIPLILASSIVLISLSAIFALQSLLPNLKLVRLLNNVTLRAQSIPVRLRSLFFFVLFLYVIYLLFDLSTDIKISAQHRGRAAVLQQSYEVEVFSQGSLPLGSPDVVPNATPTLLHYNGLRLLTFNNGKYYLFRDVDPTTCKLSEVFVISDSPDVHLVVRPIAPIDTPCADKAP